MKSFLKLGLFALFSACLAVAIPPEPAQAQNLLTVTKITSATTGGGNVLMENAGTLTNAHALSYHKSALYVRTYGYTGGSVWIQERGSGKTIFRGPVAGITFVPAVTGDSLKILYCRQYLTN